MLNFDLFYLFGLLYLLFHGLFFLFVSIHVLFGDITPINAQEYVDDHDFISTNNHHDSRDEQDEIGKHEQLSRRWVIHTKPH